SSPGPPRGTPRTPATSRRSHWWRTTGDRVTTSRPFATPPPPQGLLQQIRRLAQRQTLDDQEVEDVRLALRWVLSAGSHLQKSSNRIVWVGRHHVVQEILGSLHPEPVREAHLWEVLQVVRDDDVRATCQGGGDDVLIAGVRKPNLADQIDPAWVDNLEGASKVCHQMVSAGLRLHICCALLPQLAGLYVLDLEQDVFAQYDAKHALGGHCQ